MLKRFVCFFMCILVSVRTCKTICALETPFACEFWQILMRSRLYCTSDLIQSLEQIIIIPFEINQVSQMFRITLFRLAEQIRSEMWFSDLLRVKHDSGFNLRTQSISTETEVCWHSVLWQWNEEAMMKSLPSSLHLLFNTIKSYD